MPEQEQQADLQLDMRGESCPYPAMHTLDTLADMPSGQLLEVITDCPASWRNIPTEIQRRAHTLARQPIQSGREYIFLIRAWA